jgi:hypothetical protein
MFTRSPRTILAVSAALALAASAFGSASVLARGPNGNADCTGDCTAEQSVVQEQTRARDGSGANQDSQTQGSRNANGRGQGGYGRGPAASERDDDGLATRGRGANVAGGGRGQNAGNGAGKGPNADGERGPGTCEECDAEMGELTDEQMAGLRFMRNEEKLAHDVYAAFAEQYGVPIFSNIAESEARHQQAVQVTLDRYGLVDRASELPAGEFSDPLISSLYDTLIEQGSASLEDAIAVGVLIEETDIADLESRLEGLEETAPDVYELYSHLLAASENHLAAFEGWL